MIYLTGDTHAHIDIKNKDFSQLKEKDYLVILGDFGFLFQLQESKEEKWWLDWLNNKPWVTLFVDGNHENFNRLDRLDRIDKFSSVVGVVRLSIFHLLRGHIYNIEGNKIFTFGGAKSIDQNSRVAGLSWWAREQANYQEQKFGLDNLEKHSNTVDYIFTHTAPSSIVQRMDNLLEKYKENTTTKYLEHIKNNIKFKKWYFGHFHDDDIFNKKFVMLYDKVIALKE
jgi:predicted phosphodiesterase